MRPVITVDTTQFQAAARALFQTSSRTMVDFINGQAFAVAIRAIGLTKKADASKIEAQLGITREIEVRARKSGPKKGQSKAFSKTILRENSFAERILLARFRETGKWGVEGNTIQEKARKLIAARKRAASFISSGWVWSVKQLIPFIKFKPRVGGMGPRPRAWGKPKGAAKRATFKPGLIEAVITNTALLEGQVKAPAPGGNPMPIAVAGLQAAINASTADMIAELQRRLNPDFKAVSARK